MARKPTGKPRGRPLKSINWDTARKLAKMQCTQEEIAGFFDVDVHTLKDAAQRELGEVFSQWLKKHAEHGKCSLRRSLWKQATDKKRPNPAIGIWLSKNYLGMQDTLQHDVTDKTLTLAYSLGK